MSLLERYRKWRDLRRELADAREVWRAGRRILRFSAHRLTPALKNELGRAVMALQRALADRNLADVQKQRMLLDELIRDKLAFLAAAAWREPVEGVAIMVGLALFLRAFVVEAFQIPSGSMIPTLQVGDRIFVNKFVYGVRVPFSLVKIMARPPHRGDIIVFNHPETPYEMDLIKRVIAVGGDEVELRSGTVWVNGAPVGRVQIAGRCTYHDYLEADQKWKERECEAFSDSLDDHKFTTLQDPLRGIDSMQKRKVPLGTVFVLGDNRDNSKDSRYWGFVPIDYIKGRAMFIWYSAGEPEGGVRTKRLFQSVD